MSTIERATEDSICRAAIACAGVVDASVVSYESRQREDEGAWFVLSIDHGTGMQVVARRRTKAELLRVVEQRKATDKGPRAKNVQAVK